jgi:alkylation response protein AidB-like acyl-CoA dehydrogenase
VSNELQEEVRAWLDEHWDPQLTVDEWWRIVGDAGWTAPHFTQEEGGRGLPRNAGATVRPTFKDYGALRPPGGLGLLMAAPTILTHGSPEQIARLIPPILRGEVNWCQLFSEPGAGSDLAGLTTRATRDGDRWIISGQKVWSSMAMECDQGMLLARTDFDVPKHKGISWFAFKLDQPGVTVRPLRQMTGDSEFNEVFIDEAEVDDADLIGGAGNGWAVTQTTLFFERTGIGAGGGGGHVGFPVPGPKGGTLGRRAGDAALDPEPANTSVINQFDDLVTLAQKHGRAADPLIRQRLAQLYAFTKLGQWNAQRAKAEAKRGGGEGIANLGKVAQTRIIKSSAQLGVDILGAEGALEGQYATSFAFSPASSIYGGADEIQRNIIAERTLGLPRDDMPGKGVPYGEFLRTLRPS